MITLNKISLSYDMNDYYASMLDFLAKGVYDTSNVAIANKKPRIGPTINSVTPTVDVNGVLSGTYYYVVVALIDGGETLPSTELQAIVTSPNNAINVVWSQNLAATGYRIFRTTIEGDYRNKFIKEVDASVSSFLDKGELEQTGAPMANIVTITGSIFPIPLTPQDVIIQVSNKQGSYTPFAQKKCEPDGTFRFDLQMLSGMNNLYAQTGTSKSSISSVNVYNLHLYLEMIAHEMLIRWQEIIEQISANPYLYSTDGVISGNLKYPTEEALTQFWGAMTSVVKPEQYTYTQYRTLLVAVITAYLRATSYKSIKDVVQAILPTWDERFFVPYENGNTGFRLGGNGIKFKAVRPVLGTKTLDYEWTGGNEYVGTERGYVIAGTASITPSPLPYSTRAFLVYLNGEKDVNGYFVVKVLETTAGGMFEPPLTEDWKTVKVLALLSVDDNDIVWISGQSYIGSIADGTYRGYFTGPFGVGRTSITMRARLNSRGYKYSRMLLYLYGLSISDPDRTIKLAMLKALVTDVKPAKMTVLIGADGMYSFEEI